MSLTWLDMLIILGIVVLILLPPKYDPAIKFKELMDDWEKRQRK